MTKTSLLLLGIFVVALLVVAGFTFLPKEQPMPEVQNLLLPPFEDRSYATSLESTSTTQTQSTSDTSDSQTPPSAKKGIPPGYSSKIIQVKFRPGTKVSLPEALLSPELKKSVVNIVPLFSLPEQELERIGAGRLQLWFQITLISGTDAAGFLEDLKLLDSVEVAQFAPLPAPPP